MKKLLRFNRYFLLLVLVSIRFYSYSQCYFVNPPDTFTNPSKTILDSKNGWYLPTSGTIRVLIVFAEINYDIGTDPNPNSTTGWPIHSLPTWADLLFDPNLPSGDAQGFITNYFQQASSGNYNVIGDYLLAPTNGGIFQVDQSNIQTNSEFSALCNTINTVMNGTFVTGHGLNDVSYFDNWTLTSPGMAKNTPSTDNPHKYDHIMFIWRNKQGYNGNGQSFTSNLGHALLGYDSDTYSHFGSYDRMPGNIARHEYSHLIYGGDNFHCGGGGWGAYPDYANYWIPLEGGWSNLGLSGCSLLSWNAWDRQRMDWTAPGNSYNPSARNSGNTAEVNSDLDASNTSQAGIYTLRDFVTTGDAIRIKLPFTNETTEYPEYIWIENHNIIDMNSSIHDQFIYQSTNSCVEPAIYGLYMYMQIDREVRQSTNSADLYGGYADYLRPITAEGFYDRSFETNLIFNSCVQGSNTNAFTRVAQNPLTGGNDQDFYTVDMDGDDIIEFNEQYPNAVENLNGVYFENLFSNGNTRQVFTINGNNKVGVGTNPSSATLMNMVSYNSPLTGAKNLRKIYLNGVSIQILNQYSNGNIQVQIRFDDVDINNDVRWCADEIVLNPVSTTSGNSLNLKSGHTITLDQGTTATRMDNPQTFNGQKVFASPTLFRCTNNTLFNMETNSNVILDNNSTLIMESGSSYIINDGCKLIVKQGSSLIIKNGADLGIYDNGSIEIENGGYICIENGAFIYLSDYLSVINLRPGYNIGINPVTGISANCTTDPSSFIVNGNGAINTFTNDQYIQNITISTNKYYNGNNISAGYDVTTSVSYGNVIIQSPAKVILDAENEIFIKNSLEIQSGSTFELK